MRSVTTELLKSDPKLVEAHVASARLALDKYDYQVASQSLNKALKLDENDPEIHMLLAKAWSGSDSEKATFHLKRALELNPKHIPSLLIQVENRLGAEDYETAELFLKKIEATNPRLPKLWALRAAIAHLEARHKEEGQFRTKALEPWGLNPEVDFTIGKHLSEHYRFSDAVTYQLRAIEMDKDYIPAKAQLAQDLLRLGQTDLGWKMVDQVRQKDPYDVSIFNLKQLESQLAKFATLEAPGFVVRMDSKEAKIYGDEVLNLLSEARTTLTEKYKMELEEPVFVEIFPRQKDFAIRTFGMPGGSGFLGVCFGRLITANSPAALRVDSNWKSVLWHEYCHVVTLQKTKNKMPRWLSEGISVYEERQRDPRWGQSMDPTYRKMILSDDLVPVSKLSSAFLQPKTPMHLQFAYFESSMVVEYWIEKYGMPSLLRLLNDLSVGMPINQALSRDTAAIEALDQEFGVYIQAKARKMGSVENSDEVFAEEKLPEGDDPAAWKDWLDDKPRNYWGLLKVSQTLLAEKQWDAALPWTLKLREIYPEDSDSNGVYGMLAAIYRAKENVAEERKALVALSERSADCKSALMRLIEIDSPKDAWEEVANWCEKLVEIDPLRPNVQESRATAADKLNRPKGSVAALQAMLELDPIDPAGAHFRLAKALHHLGEDSSAKRHVLQALEESPRYRDALRLLVELQPKVEKEPSPNDQEKENDKDKENDAEPAKMNPTVKSDTESNP